MARAGPTVWYAEEGSVSIGGRLYSTQVTEVEVSGGNRDIEQIRTFGNNSLIAERPQEIFETTITAITSGVNLARHVFGLGSTTGGGFVTSGDATRSQTNLVYSWRDPTDTNGAAFRIAMFSGFATQDTISNSTDEEMRESFTFKTAANNVRFEFTSVATGSPLVTAAT